jgi:aryl-phospho-beta-D-glucosidase BglC (GH1 family)
VLVAWAQTGGTCEIKPGPDAQVMDPLTGKSQLVQESTNGFKTAGHGFTIPDNKEWHTARFRLDVPQFVNGQGYTFALASDGNTSNRYHLQSVEVRKAAKAD